MDTKPIDTTCLSWWFPKLAKVAPHPVTIIVPTEPDLRGDELIHLLDGNLPEGFEAFMTRLKAAVTEIGTPCFLRTGHSSFKHQWKDTCHLTDPERLNVHFGSMVDLSAASDLPMGTWVVRKMLPVDPCAHLGLYGGMPLVPEIRAFIDQGKPLCVHPYWPPDAIRAGLTPDQLERVTPEFANLVNHIGTLMMDQLLEVHRIITAVATEFANDGPWSLDLLETAHGWAAIDMAPARRSWHDPDCPVANWLKHRGTVCGCRIHVGEAPLIRDAVPGCPFCDGSGILRRTVPLTQEERK